MAFDKITALAAPPGSSLTGRMGKWSWEQPPQFSDPNDAVDFVVNKMRDKDTEDDLVALMAAGITIEELVDQVAFKGFMQGFYNMGDQNDEQAMMNKIIEESIRDNQR